ncbi:hypothetical protein D9613_009882 [Agrocybe pediades]|uniref:BTB domain-containing protein n=1 Tax=Agrocybe pediades TaxID=84607 RepID=A0A8H4QW20_9AGAR|nr:hypothetical protein D9613_009882 [Agrocybe pediades]
MEYYAHSYGAENLFMMSDMTEAASITDDTISWSTNTFSEMYVVTSDSSEATVTVSTTFNLDRIPNADTFFQSPDGVTFCVESDVILEACSTAFHLSARMQPSSSGTTMSLMFLDIPSEELNVLLHALYCTSPAANSPDIDTLVRAIDCMSQHGLTPSSLMQASSPLHGLVLSHAPRHPVKVYALAARHGLTELARKASSYLLEYDLKQITDEVAERIGPLYLLKVAVLQIDRFNSLKNILLRPPVFHAPIPTCTLEDQRALTRIWSLAACQFAWETRMDLTEFKLRSQIDPGKNQLKCKKCQKILDDQVKDVLAQWMRVRRTI